MAPNIIFCMCDELRWCEVGCYGHPTIRTPHIDQLAADGTLFDVAVSNAPVCMAARSMILSGQYSRTACGMNGNAGWPAAKGGGWDVKGHSLGFPQWPTGDRVHLPLTTLPEALRDRGYHTAAIGKWHIEAWPHCIGFDHAVIPAHHHTNTSQWFIENAGVPHCPQGFGVDYERRRVAEYLQNRSGDGRPFFLYYNISPPHMPLADAPDKYTRMYRREDVVVRGNVDLATPLPQQQRAFLTYLWDYRYYRDKLPYTLKLPWEGFDLVDLTAMYMGLTTWVDDTVGAMLTTLNELGLAENTVVVFTSDHGDNLGSWGRMGKGMWRDESARIPMIVRGPEVKPGHVSDRVASLLDWAPTILELVDGRPAALPHWHGRSLAPSLAGQPTPADDNYAIIEAEVQGVAVRTPTEVLGIPNVRFRQLADQPSPKTSVFPASRG